MTATAAQDLGEADYVIVGAGSSGCVLAARLSEDPSCRVVLLEAGGADDGRWIHIPLGFAKLYGDPHVDWCFSTDPDPANGGRSIFWPRGKILGGSSSVNGMVYIRGQAEDFDHWRQLGNHGWSFEDVLPYFKRGERHERGADAYHGSDGPLDVSGPRDRHPLDDAFMNGAVRLGFPVNPDFNAASQDGVGRHDVTMRRGRRCSTAQAYLRAAMNRPNLRVITRALAERVLFSGTSAIGVAFRRDGVACRVTAKAETILCGGAVNSPQLLMLSGIGPAEHLRDFSIPVVYDLPGVGSNLRDHYAATIKVRCRLPVTLNDVMRSPARKLAAGLRYYATRRGPLAAGPLQVGLFARSRAECASPDVKISLAPYTADRPQDGLHKFSGFTIVAYQLRPESAGEIRLRSAAADAHPAIRPNYLSAELDQRTLVAGLHLARRLLATPDMAHYAGEEFQPGPGVRSDDELLHYARQSGGTVFHPTSTCRMGVDSAAVVDPALRVRGVERLRVADASIMPTIPSGNTNAPAIMIGEKAADLLRARGASGIGAKGLSA